MVSSRTARTPKGGHSGRQPLIAPRHPRATARDGVGARGVELDVLLSDCTSMRAHHQVPVACPEPIYSNRNRVKRVRARLDGYARRDPLRADHRVRSWRSLNAPKHPWSGRMPADSLQRVTLRASVTSAAVHRHDAAAALRWRPAI